MIITWLLPMQDIRMSFW